MHISNAVSGENHTAVKHVFVTEYASDANCRS